MDNLDSGKCRGIKTGIQFLRVKIDKNRVKEEEFLRKFVCKGLYFTVLLLPHNFHTY